MAWSPESRVAAAAARKHKGGNKSSMAFHGKPPSHGKVDFNPNAPTNHPQVAAAYAAAKSKSVKSTGMPKTPGSKTPLAHDVTPAPVSSGGGSDWHTGRDVAPRDLKGAKSQAAFIAENKRKKGYAKTFANQAAAKKRKDK